MSQNRFSVEGTRTLLNGQPFLVKGLRFSNGTISDAATDELIGNLDVFAGYGCNSLSVFFQGSRFGDVKGYREDASLDPAHAARMGRIIEAADARSMVVLVGCLYWGNSRGKWESWTQTEANAAVRNTVQWLADHDYRNVFVDVDNEGMGIRFGGFDDRELVLAGKAADPTCVIATNFHGDAPPEADLGIHHSNRPPGRPYIETEGSAGDMPDGKGYWGPYSNPRDGSYNYTNIGFYTEAMKACQIAKTREHLDNGMGYMMASTWLQCPPPGPHHRPGGYGGPDDPGVRWWLEFLQETYGPYTS